MHKPEAQTWSEQRRSVCVAGAFRVHRHPGRRAHLLHHAAHPETEHDGVPCGRSLGVPSRAVFPAKPVFLHGDLWPAGSGTHTFSFCFLQWKFLAFHARSMSLCTCSSSYAFFPWCSASNSEASLFLTELMSGFVTLCCWCDLFSCACVPWS